MIDKKTEAGIKAIRGFLEFWEKFHSVYSVVISKDIISRDDEGKFLSTKVMIRKKYDDLRDKLDYKYMPQSRLTDPVLDILGLETLHIMSEKNLKKLDDSWKDSYIFLNSILERLENRKRRLDQFNTIGVFVKKMLDRIRSV
jgi:hypothetical protein